MISILINVSSLFHADLYRMLFSLDIYDLQTVDYYQHFDNPIHHYYDYFNSIYRPK